jgi:hypothetical protein
MAIETILAMRKENRTAITPVTNSSLTSSIFFYQSKEKKQREGEGLLFSMGEVEKTEVIKGSKQKRRRGKGYLQGRAKHILHLYFAFWLSLYGDVGPK